MLRRLTAAFTIFLAGCVTAPPPIDDYTMARAALEAARTVEAARHSPGFYHQAEESYRKAKLLFEEREFERAKEQFVRSRLAAEKAENSARLIRMKSGEVL
ncbi:MAG: DUF4398 domain-containing protein [Bdellovibrio sp.]|jgi:hypothetical protein